MSSIFSKIVNNEIPSFKVSEDENYLAFLDAFPLSYGHVLVIPKKQTDYLFDLDPDKYLGLWNFSQKVAKAMDKVISCKRIGVCVIGLEVSHAHIHLIPINTISDINFAGPKLKFSDEQMNEVAQKISSVI